MAQYTRELHKMHDLSKIMVATPSGEEFSDFSVVVVDLWKIISLQVKSPKHRTCHTQSFSMIVSEQHVVFVAYVVVLRRPLSQVCM